MTHPPPRFPSSGTESEPHAGRGRSARGSRPSHRRPVGCGPRYATERTGVSGHQVDRVSADTDAHMDVVVRPALRAGAAAATWEVRALDLHQHRLNYRCSAVWVALDRHACDADGGGRTHRQRTSGTTARRARPVRQGCGARSWRPRPGGYPIGHVRHGKLTEATAVEDSLTRMRQLGLIPGD